MSEEKSIKKILFEYKKEAENKMQELTVFMLTYNRENYAKLAIESLLKQSYTNFQIIILDNMSEDNTEGMVRKFIKDHNVKYIRRKSCFGNSNIEFAFLNCVTPFVAVVHDDDLYEKDYIRKVLQIIKDQNLAVVTVGASLIDEQGRKIGSTVNRKFPQLVYFKNKDYITGKLNRTRPGMMYPSAIYRIDFYKTKFAFFFENKGAGPAADQLVWFQTERKGGELCIINEELMNYRCHEHQDSNYHAGFMDLQLYDFMLSENYYKKILTENRLGLSRNIFHAFLTLTVRFHRGKITEEAYANFYKYRCITFIKNYIPGEIIMVLSNVLFSHRRLTYLLLKLTQKV